MSQHQTARERFSSSYHEHYIPRDGPGRDSRAVPTPAGTAQGRHQIREDTLPIGYLAPLFASHWLRICRTLETESDGATQLRTAAKNVPSPISERNSSLR